MTRIEDVIFLTSFLILEKKKQKLFEKLIEHECICSELKN